MRQFFAHCKQPWRQTPLSAAFPPPSFLLATKTKLFLPNLIGILQLTSLPLHLSPLPSSPLATSTPSHPSKTLKDMLLALRLMSPTSPKPSTDSSSNISSPPLMTSTTDSSSSMSWDTSPSEMRNDSHHPDTLLESTFFRNSEEKPPQTAQTKEHVPQPEEPA